MGQVTPAIASLFVGALTDSHVETSHRLGPVGAGTLNPNQVVSRLLVAVNRLGVAVPGHGPRIPIRPDRHGRARLAEVPRLAVGLAEKRPHLERDRVARANTNGRRVARVDRG